MSGTDLNRQREELGVSVAAFARESDISVPTLTRLFEDDPSVRPETRHKAISTLRRLKEHAEQAKRSKVAG